MLFLKVSRLPRPPSQHHTLITNAPSLLMFLFVDVFSKVSYFPIRCLVLWSFAEIIFITLRSTTDLRNVIITSQHTCPQHLHVLVLEILSLLANADLSQRLFVLTWSVLKRKELRVTSERLLSCSENDREIIRDRWPCPLTWTDRLSWFKSPKPNQESFKAFVKLVLELTIYERMELTSQW
jgi:hypothetical protein